MRAQLFKDKIKVSQDLYWLRQTPNWVWYSFIPYFGGLAIAYAGQKSNIRSWMGWGVAITLAALAVSSSTNLGTIVWIAQIVTAFSLKKRYLIKTAPRGLLVPASPTNAEELANVRGKIDINECTKDDMVRILGLPIVYANDIESLQNEGYIFTHAEELSEIAGVPESHVRRIAPMICFSYNYQKELQFTWKRLNILSPEELIASGLDRYVAEKIVRERQRKGAYKSVVEVKRRTGLPFDSYRHIC
ncbi:MULTISPECIES: helix-hairpin-helix domain-containing protein [unclassified Microcoleus]|uniref:helix-hairpin-helix domain-containing protein n=1 Tax=unclassified Microcoleus TaxID=2642155 RepID=UPI002FD02BD4